MVTAAGGNAAGRTGSGEYQSGLRGRPSQVPVSPGGSGEVAPGRCETHFTVSTSIIDSVNTAAQSQECTTCFSVCMKVREMRRGRAVSCGDCGSLVLP